MKKVISFILLGIFAACFSGCEIAENGDGANEVAPFIQKADFDLSDNESGDLNLGGVAGRLQSVMAENGEESEALTGGVKITDGVLVIERQMLRTLSAGIWTVTATTDTSTYRSEVTVATYVLSDYPEFNVFHDALKNNAAATKDWYVVLDKNINAADSATGSRMLGNGKWCSFNGTFDGRGYVIFDLQVNRFLLKYLNGTMKNVGFANLQQYGTLHGENACFIQGGTGELSNVYVSASVLNDSLVAYTGLTIKNVVFDVTYTGGETSHVLFGLATEELTLADGADEPKYTSDCIYITGKTQGAGEVYFSKLYRDLGGEIRAVNSLEEVYPSVSFLANRKNQNGELFASEKGWSSIWKIEDDDVYFGNWKIS